MSTIVKPKAVDLLRRSSLNQTQLEMMGEDVDITQLYVTLGHKNLNIVEAVTDVTIARTIEGASTVTVPVTDIDHRLLRSGKLSSGQDIEIDGLFFRLVQVSKQDVGLTLTFEDREVAVLRKYKKAIKQALKTSRDNTTRAQFILRMLKEVKELPPIPYVIPELNVTEPIASTAQLPDTLNQLIGRGYGIPKLNGLTVKHQPMDEEQRVNADIVMNTGLSMAVPFKPRPLLVMAIMASIQESTLRNLLGGDRDSVGIFQQRASMGWPASRDIATDAHEFYKRLIPLYQATPNAQYWTLIQGVQRSGFPTAYSQWLTEAQRIVTAYGVTDGTAADANSSWNVDATVSGDYEFYRGIPPTANSQRKKGKTNWGPEDSWTCMGRLADEVQWRRFFVSGVFYYLSEDLLFKSKPIAVIDEDTTGVMSINGDYDENKPQSSLTVTCEMGRWQAPPGSVIQVQNMGPWNGRWLVNDVTRSAFSAQGTITLKKPLPRLPEPSGSNVSQGVSAPQTWAGLPIPTDSVPAAAAASIILNAYNEGHFRDDNGKQIAQLQKIQKGYKLHNQCGHDITMTPGPLNAITFLLQKGFWVGTYAICEDHHCNLGQHPLGQAVDISSLGMAGVGWRSLNTVDPQGKILAMNAMKLLAQFGAWDLICNGVGQYDTQVQALQVDNGHPRSGVWADDHINHIHFGSASSPSGVKH